MTGESSTMSSDAEHAAHLAGPTRGEQHRGERPWRPGRAAGRSRTRAPRPRSARIVSPTPRDQVTTVPASTIAEDERRDADHRGQRRDRAPACGRAGRTARTGADPSCRRRRTAAGARRTRPRSPTPATMKTSRMSSTSPTKRRPTSVSEQQRREPRLRRRVRARCRRPARGSAGRCSPSRRSFSRRNCATIPCLPLPCVRRRARRSGLRGSARRAPRRACRMRAPGRRR